eukprot:3413074-Prorocentrum_lima.AAC.1
MAHRTLQDARALLELQDHLQGLSERGAEVAVEGECVALVHELEAAKSMVASRDMLAAQWGLDALL